MNQTPALKSLLPLLLAAIPLLFPLPAGAEPSVPVRVTNLPATQSVAGTVSIGNTVPVTVTNAPATQAVTGTVNIGNAVQVSGPVTVTGSVEAKIAPGSVSATLAPGAEVSVTNFPAAPTGLTHMNVPAVQHVSLIGGQFSNGSSQVLGLRRVLADGTVEPFTTTPQFLAGTYGPPAGFSLVVTDFTWLVASQNQIQFGQLTIATDVVSRSIFSSSALPINGFASQSTHLTSGIVITAPARLGTSGFAAGDSVYIQGYLVATPP